MFYTIFVILVWLLLGAQKVIFDFNPILAAFVLAIILDLTMNRGIWAGWFNRAA